MKKSFYIKFIALTLLNIAVCLFAIIAKSPNNIPVLFNFKEQILLLGSKWLLILCVIIPTILCIIVLLTQKKLSLNFFFKMMFVTSLYENMLIMICVSLSESFTKNNLFEIPLSLFVFLPIAIHMIVGSIKIKHIKFKDFSPFKNKFSTASDFVWAKTHLYAQKVLFGIGFIYTIISIIFAVLRLFIINLIVLMVCIILIYIFVIRESKLMFTKYSEMQEKKDNLSKSKNTTK